MLKLKKKKESNSKKLYFLLWCDRRKHDSLWSPSTMGHFVKQKKTFGFDHTKNNKAFTQLTARMLSQYLVWASKFGLGLL